MAVLNPVSDQAGACVAARLLQSGITNNEEASFSRLAASDFCEVQQLQPGSCFSSHARYALPHAGGCLRDGRTARRGGSTLVHRFVLSSDISLPLNGKLRQEAQAQMAESLGVTISNRSGFHGREEVWNDETRWYGELRAVVAEAVRAADEHGAGRSRCWEITGWLNGSSGEAFNTLHDHGECPSRPWR